MRRKYYIYLYKEVCLWEEKRGRRREEREEVCNAQWEEEDLIFSRINLKYFQDIIFYKEMRSINNKYILVIFFIFSIILYEFYGFSMFGTILRIYR